MHVTSRHGSSPLARGLPLRIALIASHTGIIPARAGFTCSSLVIHTLQEAGGSSPLARGLLRPAPGGDRRHRIIPARAGFTVDFLCMTHFTYGSSPLARGLPRTDGYTYLELRIIPARAGFTTDTGSKTRAVKDHPRSRGVYGLPNGTGPDRRGSSPLARGLQKLNGGAGPACRIIPARAGFTATQQNCSREYQDHPRSRGVYRSPRGHARRAAGSSPLARGLRRCGRPRTSRRRIIPARAGFTRRRPRRTSGTRDHPRSRGVYRTCCCRPMFSLGSSPLARGLQVVADTIGGTRRIIPARAGFTCP